MATDLMTAEEIKCWILVMLGAPTLADIELQQVQLDVAYENAIRWFAAGKGQRKFNTFYSVATQGQYTLPDDVNRVLDCYVTGTGFDSSVFGAPFWYPEGLVPGNLFGGGGMYGGGGNSMGGLNSYVQVLQYIETSRRIMGSEFDWMQEGKTLFLFPSPRETSTVIYLYSTSKVTPEQLSERDHDLIKRYALAQAKIILGRIRSRWGSVPTAQGERQLDGQALLSEGQAEVEALNAELGATAGAPGIVIG